MRILYLTGASLIIAASIGLFISGTALSEIFNLLHTPISNEKPSSLGNMLPFMFLVVLVAMGQIACSFCIFKSKSGVSYFRSGRLLHIFAGVLIVVAAGIAIHAMFQTRIKFYGLTAQAGNPPPDQIKQFIAQGIFWTRVAVTLLGCAGILFFISALRFLSPDRNCYKPTSQATQWVAIGFTSFFAIFFAFMFLVTALDEARLISMIRDSTQYPGAQRITGYLSGVVNNSIVAFIMLFLSGIAQIVGGFIGPGNGIQTEVVEEEKPASEKARVVANFPPASHRSSTHPRPN